MEGVTKDGYVLYCVLYIGLAWGQLKQDYIGSELHCPDVNAYMMTTEVPWGVPGRAYLTLPPGLVIAPSKIKGAGFGVLSETFIPRYTWLGEYDGEIVSRRYGRNVSGYTWTAHRKGFSNVYIDAYYLHLSSYHRYINAPLRYRDENVQSVECYGRIYYITKKDVSPGTELLVYYGHGYAQKRLGINLNDFYEVPLELRRVGLDLNKMKHVVFLLHKNGVRLHDAKYLTASWLLKVNFPGVCKAS